MIYVGVTGAAGRMGAAIIEAIKDNPLVTLTGALEKAGSPVLGLDAGTVSGVGELSVEITDDRAKAFKRADVIIDFSMPEATLKTVDEVLAHKKAIVIGTTGFSHHQRDRIKELARKVRIVMAPNMSVGVNLLAKLVHDAATVLGDSYDVEIVEAHHRHKKDAPSGTAIHIAEVAAAALGRDLKKVAVYERKGIIGERTRDEIGIQSIRAGDTVGDHTIFFAGMGERIELTHRASSRQTFAMGAVRAAIWVVEKPSGFYDMQDVLDLK